MANCLWNDFEGHRKLHLANGKLVCMKKEFWGMDIPNLQQLNMCLLDSWVQRYSKGKASCGGKWLIRNIAPTAQTSSPAIPFMPLGSGKGLCVWLNLDTGDWWGMADRLGFGRISGWAMPPSKNNILPDTILCITRVILSPR